MYSASNVAVDKGLGFDFSDISNLVKSALPVGLNIFQQQMQLKQVKAIGQANIDMGYNVPVVGLPAAQMYWMRPQPNIPGQFVPVQKSMFDTTTMLSIGGAAVVGILAYKMLR